MEICRLKTFDSNWQKVSQELKILCEGAEANRQRWSEVEQGTR